jgi:hypothetical protein
MIIEWSDSVDKVLMASGRKAYIDKVPGDMVRGISWPYYSIIYADQAKGSASFTTEAWSKVVKARL